MDSELRDSLSRAGNPSPAPPTWADGKVPLLIYGTGSVGQDVLCILKARGFPVAAVAVTHTVLIEKETWRQVKILVLITLPLPPISGDHRLLLIYLPLYLFLSSDRPSRLDAAFLAVFGLLLVPKNYYYYLPHVLSDAPNNVHDTSIAVSSNVILLLLLGLLIVIPGLLDRCRQIRNSRAPVEVELPG